MRPLVSIIVPTYRRDRVLCETLDSLLAQDYPHCEVLVADQSPNHEPATLAYLQQVRDRIRYLQLAQANLPAARNHAIRASCGAIVVFFDDDVLVPPDTISRLVETYAEPRVWSATGFVPGPGESELDLYRRYFGPEVQPDQVRSIPPFRCDHFIGCFMSFRREVFARIGYFDEWLGTQTMAAGEDKDFCRRIVQAGLGVHLNPAIVVRHLAAPSGGCNRRSLDPDQVRREQMRLNAYTIFKTRAHPGLLGWLLAFLRCYRETVLANVCLRPHLLLRHHWALYAGFRNAIRAGHECSWAAASASRVEGEAS